LLWVLHILVVKLVEIKRSGKIKYVSRCLYSFVWNRYNDLYRDLTYHNIREPDVRLILVNEQQAVNYLPGTYYGKIRLFQDNYKDRAIEKLGYHGQRLNNLIFGRLESLIMFKS